jgi:hypothetical protein
MYLESANPTSALGLGHLGKTVHAGGDFFYIQRIYKDSLISLQLHAVHRGGR